MKESIKKRIEAVRRGEIPEGYRAERAMLFPNDWGEPVELNTVLSENKDRNEDLRFGKEDVLSVSGEQGVINQITLLGRSYAGESVAAYHVVETGDVVYTKSPLKENPYGIIKQNRGAPGIVSTLYAVYHCSTPITGWYLENYFCIDTYLNNYLKPLVKRGAKNDMKVNNEEVLLGRIPLPSLQEQERINEIIAQFDRIIELKQQLLEEKRRQKQWLMQKLLVPNSGVRLPGYAGKWKQLRLRDLGSFSKGSGISNDDCSSGDCPCIKYGDIYVAYSEYFMDAVSHTEEDIFGKAPTVSDGALLFTGSGEDPKEIGKCTVYLGNEPIAVGGDIIIMKPKRTMVNPLFLAYALNAYPAIKQKACLGQGYSIVHIYGEDIKKIGVYVPPTIEEQERIAEIIKESNSAICLIEDEIAEWQQKKKALMQLLLTGLVRV